MKWSVSGAKTFRRCQRQWFYKNCVANGVTKDAVRRNVYLLSKLQSIAGWRGTLIDDVITNTVIPALQSKRSLSLEPVLTLARRMFDRQLATALKHPLRQPDRSVKSWGDDYAAFHCVEYGDGPTQKELDDAWNDIDVALTNLLSMRSLLDKLRAAKQLLSQRSLQFSTCGVTVSAVPDLIAFYSDEPPAILDWKAHAFGTMDAWLQLAIYSIALKACNPHKDFPASLAQWPVSSIRLVEVQLLLKRLRRHEIDEDDRESAEAFIAESAMSMLMAMDGKKAADIAADDFATTSFEGACERCSFRKSCWETMQ